MSGELQKKQEGCQSVSEAEGLPPTRRVIVYGPPVVSQKSIQFASLLEKARKIIREEGSIEELDQCVDTLVEIDRGKIIEKMAQIPFSEDYSTSKLLYARFYSRTDLIIELAQKRPAEAEKIARTEALACDYTRALIMHALALSNTVVPNEIAKRVRLAVRFYGRSKSMHNHEKISIDAINSLVGTRLGLTLEHSIQDISKLDVQRAEPDYCQVVFKKLADDVFDKRKISRAPCEHQSYWKALSSQWQQTKSLNEIKVLEAQFLRDSFLVIKHLHREIVQDKKPPYENVSAMFDILIANPYLLLKYNANKSIISVVCAYYRKELSSLANNRLVREHYPSLCVGLLIELARRELPGSKEQYELLLNVGICYSRSGNPWNMIVSSRELIEKYRTRVIESLSEKRINIPLSYLRQLLFRLLESESDSVQKKRWQDAINDSYPQFNFFSCVRNNDLQPAIQNDSSPLFEGVSVARD